MLTDRRKGGRRRKKLRVKEIKSRKKVNEQKQTGLKSAGPLVLRLL